MGYQGEGEGAVGKEVTWLVGKRVDMSGQADQKVGKGLGEKH